MRSKQHGQYKRYDAGKVFSDAVENYIERTYPWAWSCCPFHDDHHPSFAMNVETGWYCCNASHCGATGSSIVSFVRDLHETDTRGALQFLEAHYG